MGQTFKVNKPMQIQNWFIIPHESFINGQNKNYHP